MKKNILRKLTLSRETLRSLTDEQSAGVNGGIDTSLQYSRCPQSCGIACTEIGRTCTCA
jgi:hypothetical protein